LELNASDERGIDVIREKVKDFARTKAFSGPFKIIFLDEADALTKEAQHALRRTMENFTSTCRFILSCNYSSKIIDPIQSRCSIFRFRLLEKTDLAKVIERIAKAERLEVDKAALDALYEVSEGDCRKAINLLQASASVDKQITEELVYEITARARPQDIAEILKLALNKDFLSARTALHELMLKQGLAGLDVVKEIQKEIWNLNISDNAKLALTEKCGEIEFRLTEGADEFVQLEALLAAFSQSS
jgi:replication factor C small subunit